MIFLHGANSAAPELAPLVEALQPYAQVRTPDMIGHGGRQVPESVTMDEIARDIVAWLDREGLERPLIGGYSFGGSVALYIARHFPERVAGVVALAPKHVFDAQTMRHWIHLVGHERLARLQFPWGKRTDELSRLHAPNTWEAVADLKARLFKALAESPPLPAAELRAIRVPVMAVSSNLDQIVPWAEMLELARQVPDCHLAMFHGPAHPLRAIALLPIARAIGGWIESKGLGGK